MVMFLGYTDAVNPMCALTIVIETTATVVLVPSVTPKWTGYVPGTRWLLGPQSKVPMTGEVPATAKNVAPKEEHSKHVRTRVCGGELLSVASTANVTVEATVTVSFPGITKTGGILRGGPFAG